jgi:pSer/pThr/pTyr-binding forkhead associated (FHA) protein
MAVTIVVRVGGSDSGELSLTLDAPRLVIGRGEGCEVRLPDPSVSHRHASLRQRGGEYVLADEGSTNGTLLGAVRLPKHAPRAVRSGELLRVGRVWLEVRLEPAIVKGSTAAAAKELALSLVARGLAAQGEEPGPRVTVLEGPDKGRTLILSETLRGYVIGRGKDTDLLLDDDGASRRHVSVTRRGDVLLVTDTSSAAPALLDNAPVGRDAVWRPGQVLAIGKSLLGFDYPAALALVELEQSPDERMRPGEAEAPPADGSADSDAAGEEPAATPDPSSAGALDLSPAPGSIDASPRRGLGKKQKPEGGWGAVDAAVVLLAVGVLVLSALGAIWLFSR